MMKLQSARQALQPTPTRLPAHAGIDDLVTVTLCLQSLPKQRNPTLFRPNPIRGTQAVAEHEEGTVGSHRVLERDE